MSDQQKRVIVRAEYLPILFGTVIAMAVYYLNKVIPTDLDETLESIIRHLIFLFSIGALMFSGLITFSRLLDRKVSKDLELFLSMVTVKLSEVKNSILRKEASIAYFPQSSENSLIEISKLLRENEIEFIINTKTHFYGQHGPLSKSLENFWDLLESKLYSRDIKLYEAISADVFEHFEDKCTQVKAKSDSVRNEIMKNASKSQHLEQNALKKLERSDCYFYKAISNLQIPDSIIIKQKDGKIRMWTVFHHEDTLHPDECFYFDNCRFANTSSKLLLNYFNEKKKTQL